jgi:hypothetical protein
MLLHNTQVAGWYPFKVGKVALTVILYRVKRVDYASRLLRLVESVSGALDFGTSVSSYVKVAESILSGVNSLLSLGDTEPLVGERIEFDSETDDGFRPGHVAIVNSNRFPEAGARFSVAENRLLYASATGNEAVAFRESDFVLYRISRIDRRADDQRLPFYPLKEDALRAALTGTDEDWKRAKATLLALYQSMKLSPDLTGPHADALFDQYYAAVESAFAKSQKLAVLDATEKAPEEGQVARIRDVARQLLG